MGNIFNTTLTTKDFMGTTDAAVVTNAFNKIGEYTVKAGQLVGIGNGNIAGMSDAIGRIYCKFQSSTPAEIKGILRISVHDAQDNPKEIIHQFRTELLNTDASDRTKQMPLPFYPLWVSRDKKIVLEFKADAAGTIDDANTIILIDANIQNI